MTQVEAARCKFALGQYDKAIADQMLIINDLALPLHKRLEASDLVVKFRNVQRRIAHKYGVKLS